MRKDNNCFLKKITEKSFKILKVIKYLKGEINCMYIAGKKRFIENFGKRINRSYFAADLVISSVNMSRTLQ